MPGSGSLNPLLAANKLAAANTAGRGSQGVANTGTNIAQQNADAAAVGVRGRGAGVGSVVAAPNTTTAPPKANAAPSVNKNIVDGLVTALNTAIALFVTKYICMFLFNPARSDFSINSLGGVREE